MNIQVSRTFKGITHTLIMTVDPNDNTYFVLDGVPAQQIYRHEKGVLYASFQTDSGNYWAVRNKNRCHLIHAGDDLTENGFEADCGKNAFGLISLFFMWILTTLLQIGVLVTIYLCDMPIPDPNPTITLAGIAVSFLINMKPIAHVSKRRVFVLLILLATFLVNTILMLAGTLSLYLMK